MFFKDLTMPANSRNTITTFLGYNHSAKISDGEFFEMENLSSDEYPLLSPRKKRDCILSLASNDWVTVDAKLSNAYRLQVSGGSMDFLTEMLPAEEKETFTVEFLADDALVEQVEVTGRMYKGDKLTETVAAREGTNGYRVSTQNCDRVRLAITVTFKHIEKLTEEKAKGCLQDITIRMLNRNIRGMLLKEGKLAYMVGSKLYYDNVEYDFTAYIPKEDDYRTEQQLLALGAYILIFPLGLYLNTADTKDMGTLGAAYLAGEHEMQVTFSLADASGKAITASTEKPENPKNGAYWLDTSREPNGLYRYSEGTAMWVSVASTYIRISMNFTDEAEIRFPDMFEEGDAVFMDSGIDGIDEGSVIVKKDTVKNDSGKITGGYIVVKGLLNKQVIKTVSGTEPMKFERRIPKLDYVCVSNNRVWGCHHGTEDGKVINEIYASKLGDAKNWYSYAGASTDSYTLSMGDDDEFTGAYTYQGYPMFFKENKVYKIYGAYPAAYQLYTYDCRGVQKGSHRSLAVINEYLMYKSVRDVCIFDGGTPVSISAALGNTKYFNAAAGSCQGKYYLSMEDAAGETVLFAYDVEKSLWHREDTLHLMEFAYNNNDELYGRNLNTIYGFGNAKEQFRQDAMHGEATIQWMAQTGEVGIDTFEYKAVRKLLIRARMPYTSRVEVSIQYDEKDWEIIETLQGEGMIHTYEVPIHPQRHEIIRIRLRGIGDCRIYAMAWETATGSEKK